MKSKNKIVIFEILILIIGIVAIGYLLGSGARNVTAQDGIMPHTKDQNPNPISKSKNTEGSNNPAALVAPVVAATGVVKNTADIAKKVSGESSGVDKIWRMITGGEEYKGGFTVMKNGKIYSWKGELIPLDDFNKIKDAGNLKDITNAAKSWKPWGFGADSSAGLVQALFWAGVVGGTIKILGNLFGMDDRIVNAASVSASMGILVGKGLQSFLPKDKLWLDMTAKGWGITAGLATAVIVFLMMYKSEDTEIVTFECKSWDAPVGSTNCQKCNEQGVLTCSEYQCRSLGQSCEIVNKGTKEEKCVAVNRGDVKPPVISEWTGALSEGYEYRPLTFESPADRGVRIVNKKSTTGCVPAFFPLSFGIKTDEPAKCKIDIVKKPSFDEMSYFFGGNSLFRENHTQVMALPGPSSAENGSLILQNDMQTDLFVRCMDANGNTNPANFVFRFCVEEGPDTTAPLIVSTNLLNGMPIAYNQTSVDLEVYVNEPSECKWTHDADKPYKDMENEMSCANNVFQMNAQMLYKCATTLTGLKNNQENKFFFKCKDQPGENEVNRNTNSQGYEFKLIGTQPLVIKSLKPNETIKDSTTSIKSTLEAETSAGYKDGNATCYFSDTGETGSYLEFFNTNSHLHSQDLYLEEGSYKYFIKCIDLGGNSDDGEVEFDVESDTNSPVVARAYHYESYLKLITNEKAECVYDIVDCNYQFSDGTTTRVLNDVEHYIDWDTQKSYYIKCKDEFGNQPLPNQCSIIAKPFEIQKKVVD